MVLLKAAIFLALLAGFLSVVLVLVSKKFAVEEDPLVGDVDEALPQYNCGACGFPGCAGFAKYLVESRDPAALCVPGGPELQKKLGMEVKEATPTVAHVFCKGTNSKAKQDGEYFGIQDCVAADLINAAPKSCPFGCMGLGSCVEACAFDAIHVVDGIAEVIEENCVACGACVKACTRGLISMIPQGPLVVVECRSKDKGAGVKRYCEVGCITCQLCVKKCPEKAIALTDGLIVIDPEKCTLCGTCIEVCPQNTILPAHFVPEKKEEPKEGTA